MKKKIKAIAVVLGLMGLYYLINVVLIIIATVVALIVNGNIVELSSNLLLVLLIITQVTTLLIMYLIFRKKPFKVYIKQKPTNKKMVLWSLIAGFLMINASMLIIELLSFIMPSTVEKYVELMTSLMGPSNFFITFISVVIMAPVVEEVMMRGILFKQFEEAKMKGWSIVIISGLMFGVFHLNIVQGLFASVVGVLCALGFLWTKTIWVPIFMHLGNNFYSVISPILPEFLSEVNILTYILAFIVLPIAMFQIYKERVQEKITMECSTPLEKL